MLSSIPIPSLLITGTDTGIGKTNVAAEMQSPAVVVARPALGTINHTLLALQALRSRNIPIVGVVINRYPTDTPGLAEETNPRAIEKYGKVPILAIVPDIPIPKVVSPH